MKLIVLRGSVFESIRILRLRYRREFGEAAVDRVLEIIVDDLGCPRMTLSVLEVIVDLARVVADTQLADARQPLQFVLVEDVAAIVRGQIASVIPRLPVSTDVT